MVRKINYLLMLALASFALFFVSCLDEKDYYDPNYETENPMGDISAPQGFDWKTIRSNEVTVQVNDEYNGKYNYLIEIFDKNPVISPDAILITNGIAKKAQPFKTSISVPNTVDNVFIRQTTPTGLASVRTAKATTGTIDCDFGPTGIDTRSAISTRVNNWLVEEPAITDDIYPTKVPDGNIPVIGSGWVGAGTVDNYKNYILNETSSVINAGYYVALYVTGNATVTHTANRHRKIYILPGKKLTIKGNFTYGSINGFISIGKGAELIVEGNMETTDINPVYNAGTITINGNFEAKGSSMIYNSGQLNVKGELKLNTGGVKLINYGEVECKNYTSTGSASTQNHNLITVAELTDMRSADKWINNGTWLTKEMKTVSYNAIYYNTCKLIVENKFELSQGRLINDGGAFIRTKYLEMVNSRVEMGSLSFFNVTEQAAFNGNRAIDTHIEGKGEGIYGTGDKQALLKMKEAIRIESSNTAPNSIHYEGNLQVACDDHFAENNKPKNNDVYWTMENGAEWASSANNTVNIPASDCNEGSGTNPGKEEDKDPKPTTDPYTYTYLFEDLWPLYGDYDMNDVVIRINQITKTLNAAGLIEKLSFNYKLEAVGAANPIGAALMLDGISATNIAFVSYSSHAPTGFNTLNSGIESEQEMAVIPLFSSAHALLGRSPGMFINTIKGSSANVSNTPTITIEVTFSNPIPADFDVKSFNLFTIANAIQGSLTSNKRKEVHVIDYAPSDRANTEIFGDNNDNSGSSKYYVSKDNLAWGIMLPVAFRWPVEHKSIHMAYDGFTEWVKSGGEKNADWWLTPVSEDEVF